MKNITIFAHYDPDNKIKESVIYYLEQLKVAGREIIFVSTAQLNELEQQKISFFVDRIIIRENVGYDFHSYKAGIESIDDPASYDQLILCNDSCYGPIFSLADIFAKMNNEAVDFWGMTSSNLLNFHLQSYFLVFNKSVLLSDGFVEFWRDLPICQERKDIIQNYEIALTQKLINIGFHATSYIPLNFKISVLWLIKRYTELLIKRYLLNSTSYSTLGNILKLRKVSELDKTIVLWDYIIEKYKMPFIKQNIIRNNIAQYPKITSLLKDNQINYPEKFLQQ